MDLDAYLARIGLAAAPAADLDGLAAVQRAHRFAIPFENLDIPLGRGIAIDPDTVFDKLVTRRRGGYCFEQNRLFGDALGALGFTRRPLLARVWLGASEVPARTHTFDLVTLDGREWIADAGFGGSFTPPMPLEEGAELATADGARHRLRRDPAHGWMLERHGHSALADGRGADDDGWLPQYSFTPDPVFDIDLALSNHWTSSAPGTRFTTLHIVSLALPDGLVALTGRRFTRHLTTGSEARDIDRAADYRAVLAETFGIALSEAEVAALGLFD